MRGVLLSVLGGEPQVAQSKSGTVSAENAVESVMVSVPSVSDVNGVVSGAVIGISVVDPVYDRVGVKIGENCPKAGTHPARPSHRALLRVRYARTAASSHKMPI